MSEPLPNWTERASDKAIKKAIRSLREVNGYTRTEGILWLSPSGDVEAVIEDKMYVFDPMLKEPTIPVPEEQRIAIIHYRRLDIKSTPHDLTIMAKEDRINDIEQSQ